ncbi:hypothetical protein [Streptomyces sp. NPDC046925]|uniref:hypothetical protein n=1 Tax=Streptomyces sp. NPDC046925 TaxID=3155375 RepID=UPI0033E3FB2F
MSTERLTAPMIRTLLDSLPRRMYTTAGVVYQVSGERSTLAALARRDLVESAHRKITREDGTPDHQATAQWLTIVGCRQVRALLEEVLARPASDRPEVYREFLTQPRRSESLAAFLLHDARRIRTTGPGGQDSTGMRVCDRAEALQQLGRAIRSGHRIDVDRNAVSVLAPEGRRTFTPLHREPAQGEQSGQASPAARRFHMRTVNGGTPERIPTARALAEINEAMMGDGRKQVKEMSAAGSRAHIWYKDGRGKVELRPASHAETAAPDIPVNERHTAGERVIVRHVSWDSYNRVHTVNAEFTGTVVRYARNGLYVVREPEHHTTCQYPVRELRPAPPL